MGIFSRGIEKGRAENLASDEKELSDAQLYNAYYHSFLLVDYSFGNIAQFTAGLRGVIKAHKKLNNE